MKKKGDTIRYIRYDMMRHAMARYPSHSPFFFLKEKRGMEITERIINERASVCASNTHHFLYCCFNCFALLFTNDLLLLSRSEIERTIEITTDARRYDMRTRGQARTKEPLNIYIF